MGTCCSSPAVPPEENEDVCSSRWGSSQRPNSTKLPPIRFGADGLFDLGFEYRLVLCDKHQQHNKTDQPQPLSYKPNEVCCDCATRLFRVRDKLMITPDNRKTHITGRLYDQIRQATHELVTYWLERDCGLKLLDLYRDDDEIGEPVRALVSQSCCPLSKTATTPPALLIITGRGTCRAGVLSTRYTIEAGLERGSALFHIVQAIQRDMTVVCLDPNARGSINGMETIFRSLKSPELAPYLQNRSLYILVHSAAGGHFVQYLLQQQQINKYEQQHQSLSSQLQHQNITDETSSTCTNGTNPSEQAPQAKEQQQHQQQYFVTMPQIHRLVFTDSTHNLQWLSLKERPDVFQFLQSPVCLYIRNNREHPGDTFGHKHRHKKAGETFTCKTENWLRRFGSINTVYAGTPDHSMMCYEARYVIWSFFDGNQQTRKIHEENGKATNATITEGAQ